MDLVALRKERWSGMEWIGKGLRIDETQLAGLCRKDFDALSNVYKHKAAKEFLTRFERELIDHKFTIDTAQHRTSGSNS